MTSADGCASSSGISIVERALNVVPPPGTSTGRAHSAAAAPVGRSASSRDLRRAREAPLRLLAWSVVGVGCLYLAQWLGAGAGSPLAGPSGPAAWTAVICGVAGIWLVPGLWLSAVMMRTGRGAVAWLATRIGATLTWYPLVGPVIRVAAHGARVTTTGIVTATAATTAAACLGVALGLPRRPVDRRLRILGAAVVGGVCAQIAIWWAMRLWTYGMNYEHIRRLDWLIVLGCALLAAIGMHCRLELPLARRSRHMANILVALAVVAVTAVALFAIGARWSPAQRMPSAFSAEQIPEPAGADVAFALSAIGPDGSGLIQHAIFTASDDTGRPVPVRTQLVGDSTADGVTLLVVLGPMSRLVLCRRAIDTSQQGWPLKLTIRDHASGMLVQAVIPDGWCG